MFVITYTLREHGWAQIAFGDGESSFNIYASYLADALGGFARAARWLLKGAADVTFSFMQEPGEHRFVVTRQGDDIRVNVFRFDKLFAKPNERGQPILSASSTVCLFANEAINCLRYVLDEYGEDGYRQRWERHEFPRQEYQDLLALRRELANFPSNGVGSP